MAHYKKSGSHSSKGENKRIDHKKQRAAERQAIENNHVRTIRSDKWSLRLDQPPLPDQPINRAKAKKNRRKWCKGRVGVEHQMEWRVVRSYWFSGSDGFRREHSWSGWVCVKCHKHIWGYKPPVQPQPTRAADHWSYNNIWLRLNGGECKCRTCRE